MLSSPLVPLKTAALFVTALALLSGCDKLNESPGFRSLLVGAEGLHQRSQRLVGGHEPLAREFSERDLSPNFRSNGSSNVADVGYQQHVLDRFANWALRVDGLVQRPLALPLAAEQLHGIEMQLRAHLTSIFDSIGEVRVLARGDRTEIRIQIPASLPPLPIQRTAEAWLQDNVGDSQAFDVELSNQ